MNHSPVRILIADDHAMMRRGLRATCESAPDITVVGEAENGAQAVALAAQLQPDVILMDLQMPVLDGVSATQQIMAHDPTSKIIVVSLFEEETQVISALQNGARGYLLKSNVKEALLIQSIYAVMAGGMLIDPSLTAQLLHTTGGTPSRTVTLPPVTSTESGLLTSNEIEILSLIACGLENTLIAKQLQLSEKTVANRLSAIYAKIHVANRVQAALYAVQHGLAQLS